MNAPVRGPIEQEIHDLLEAPPPPPEWTTAEMFVYLLGHFSRVEQAIERLAQELDRRGTAS